MRKSIHDGRLSESVTRKGSRYLINPELADAEWKANTRPTCRPTEASHRPTLSSVKRLTHAEGVAAKVSLQAHLLELEVLEREGQLLDADKVRRQVELSFRELRDRILNVPVRVASLVAAETDPRRVEELMRQGLEDALETFAEGAA
ncbi:hypothetical protein [Synechococcus sp. RSCCF101]|uniref:hypothetical protein n=1 Tax=Synechococcus sp. RSCCF101 TaxID=2511069 RepID=UPI001246F8E1|nr:hypothetical protein [Synechococcus sp. RSCCF101]